MILLFVQFFVFNTDNPANLSIALIPLYLKKNFWNFYSRTNRGYFLHYSNIELYEPAAL